MMDFLPPRLTPLLSLSRMVAAIILEDYGFAGTIAEAFGVKYSGYQLFDTTYATELNYNYVWMCVQSTLVV